MIQMFIVTAKSASKEILSSLDYGVDVSFPIHRYIQDKSSHFYERYQKTMAGCYKAYSKSECDATERARMSMNLEQPKNQHNYTENGFKKTRVPLDLWNEILQFYEANKLKEKPEEWPRGNTYVNAWESPSYMINFEDKSLRGGWDMKQRIWASVKPIISEWTGKALMDTSLYGIRVYRPGSILATHVDRLPLVSSCIIQVDLTLTFILIST
jgi:prolyl 4-hydroxylase